MIDSLQAGFRKGVGLLTETHEFLLKAVNSSQEQGLDSALDHTRSRAGALCPRAFPMEYCCNRLDVVSENLPCFYNNPYNTSLCFCLRCPMVFYYFLPKAEENRA